MAGGPQEGNIGLFLVASGFALCLFRSSIRVESSLFVLGLLLIICCTSALLPQRFSSTPPWREQLSATGVIPIGSLISVTPRETLFWLALLTIGTCVVLYALTQPLRSRALLAAALGAIITCGCYAGLALWSRHTGWRYPFDSDPSFGFFPNRNHTATFLITGNILVLGVLTVAFREKRWGPFLAGIVCLATCLIALALTGSRGGIAFLVAGASLWVIGLGARHRSRRLLWSFIAIFLSGAVLFFASGTTTRDRLVKLVGLDGTSLPHSPDAPRRQAAASRSEADFKHPPDSRVLIFKDALQIVRDFPLTGTGLGTFPYVFPFYRKAYLSDSILVHPESDWLHLAAEAGVPAVVVVLAAIGMLIPRTWKLQSHPYWPLRWAFLSAALAALLHGLVDVPVHRVALGWWILILAGLGLQVQLPGENAAPPPLQRWLFAIVGIGAVAMGLFLICAEWFAGSSSPPFAAEQAEEKIGELQEKGKAGEAIILARESIKASPMADALYFMLGVSLLDREETRAEADAIFRAQRMLVPDWPQLPFVQGTLWIQIDPAKTAALWLEALRRRERIDRNQRVALRWYKELVRKGAGLPLLQRGLLAASEKGSEFTLAWLEHADADLVAVELPRFAADESFLPTLSETNRRRFLNAWYRKGDRESLFQFVATRPDWQEAAAPSLIRRLVDAGKFEEAVHAVCERYGVNLALPGPGDAEPSGLPPAELTAAFEHYWSSRNEVTALRILQEAVAQKSAVNPEVWRLKAAVSASRGEWRPAWENLEKYVRATKGDSAL